MIVKIKEITDINKKNISQNYDKNYINYLDTANITNGKIDTIVKLNIKDIPSRAKRIVKKNDIIYSTVRPNLCHYGILRNIVDNMVVST
ncbi:MAG: restriction endonuclease subunit S, partial [Clostridia bacterium]|nr:restriction endonuclease subunit S [Clostridia bacterium]